MIRFEKGSFILKNGKRFSLAQILRHAVQLAAFLLFPGLFLTVFHALRDLVAALVTGTFTFSAMAPGVATLAILFAVTALWGRFFCGYLCSFGAMQELAALASRKLIPRKKPISAKADRILKCVKYAVLLAIVLFVWVLQLPVDSSMSPWGVFGMLVSGNGSVMLSAIPTVGFAILVAILIASFFVERFFCRYLCPLGALFTPMSKGRLFRIRRKETACSGCQRCSRACAMGVTVHETDRVKSGECIDCMRCLGVCAPEALKANPSPAIAGTASALVLCGALRLGQMIPAGTDSENLAVASETAGETGAYADGVYTGSGSGFRGTVSSQVTVENGRIADITILSYADDSDYFRRAQSGVIGAILSAQTPQVNAVSGATFSSCGIMESVADALQLADVKAAVAEQAQSGDRKGSRGSDQGGFTFGSGESNAFGRQEGDSFANGQPGEGKRGGRGRHGQGEQPNGERQKGERENGQNGQSEGGLSFVPNTQTEEPETEAQTPVTEASAGYADGVYTGRGTGYRGETEVSVTVENGRITDITVLSYKDDQRYFSRAQDSLIEAILLKQGIGVNTVSGATFSSNGILEAVADALDLPFTNPNATSSHGGHR